MKSRKVMYVFLGLLFVLISGGTYLSLHRNNAVPTLSFPDSAFHYEIVTTPEAQERGLGGRREIPDNYGMLFVFSSKDRYGFWMKDMLTPIDIVWLNDDGTIMKIDANVDPSTYPTPYYPSVPVQYVLETRAGYAMAHDWKVGTALTLPGPYTTK